MKLTRYDLILRDYQTGKLQLSNEQIKQILKNQKIVERLKKEIEDIKQMTASDYLKLDLEDELQKILGEDNE